MHLCGWLFIKDCDFVYQATDSQDTDQSDSIVSLGNPTGFTLIDSHICNLEDLLEDINAHENLETFVTIFNEDLSETICDCFHYDETLVDQLEAA